MVKTGRFIFYANNAFYACKQLFLIFSAGCNTESNRYKPVLFKQQQCRSIITRMILKLDHHIIATVFTFLPDAGGYLFYKRVEKEKYFNTGNKNINEVIIAFYMNQLM